MRPRARRARRRRPPRRKGATPKKGAPKGRKAAEGGKAKAAKPAQDAKAGKKPAKAARTKEPRTPRANSKQSEVIDLMRRKDGATLAEIIKRTGWQAHTVRGFVSGTLGKKLGLKVESSRSDEGERTYRITA